MFDIGDIVVSSRVFGNGDVSKFVGKIKSSDNTRYYDCVAYVVEILIHQEDDRIGQNTFIRSNDSSYSLIVFV